MRNKSQLPYTLLLLAVGTGTTSILFLLAGVMPAFEMDITLTAILLILALATALIDYKKLSNRAKKTMDTLRKSLGDEGWIL